MNISSYITSMVFAAFAMTGLVVSDTTFNGSGAAEVSSVVELGADAKSEADLATQVNATVDSAKDIAADAKNDIDAKIEAVTDLTSTAETEVDGAVDINTHTDVDHNISAERPSDPDDGVQVGGNLSLGVGLSLGAGANTSSTSGQTHLVGSTHTNVESNSGANVSVQPPTADLASTTESVIESGLNLGIAP